MIQNIKKEINLKRFGYALLVLVIIAVFGPYLAASQPESGAKYSPAQIIMQLKWLEGEWSSDSFSAIYSSPEGGIIMSISKEFDKGELVFFEFETIIATDSLVALTPYPYGSKSVHFTLVEYDPDSTKAVFENKAHDFPTRISYELISPNNLLIIVSGIESDKPVEIRYDLIKKQKV